VTRTHPAASHPAQSRNGPGTAIPTRYPRERNRVLTILARWEESLDSAEPSLVESGR